jgi:hypothetical protein
MHNTILKFTMQQNGHINQNNIHMFQTLQWHYCNHSRFSNKQYMAITVLTQTNHTIALWNHLVCIDHKEQKIAYKFYVILWPCSNESYYSIRKQLYSITYYHRINVDTSQRELECSVFHFGQIIMTYHLHHELKKKATGASQHVQ